MPSFDSDDDQDVSTTEGIIGTSTDDAHGARAPIFGGRGHGSRATIVGRGGRDGQRDDFRDHVGRDVDPVTSARVVHPHSVAMKLHSPRDSFSVADESEDDEGMIAASASSRRGGTRHRQDPNARPHPLSVVNRISPTASPTLGPTTTPTAYRRGHASVNHTSSSVGNRRGLSSTTSSRAGHRAPPTPAGAAADVKATGWITVVSPTDMSHRPRKRTLGVRRPRPQ